MKTCKNSNCKKKLPKGRRKYCSDKCQYKDRYKKKADYYKENARKWEKNNPEKFKESILKANKKFRENNRKRFNELMLKQYYKNKPKWFSRQQTREIINSKRKILDIDKFCKKCNKKENLSLKFTIYPKNAKAIRQAIKDKQIYYLCKGCRYGT